MNTHDYRYSTVILFDLDSKTVHTAPVNFVGRIPPPEGRAFPATEEEVAAATPIVFGTLTELHAAGKQLESLSLKKRASRKADNTGKSCDNNSPVPAFTAIVPNPISTPPYVKRLESKFGLLQKEVQKT